MVRGVTAHMLYIRTWPYVALRQKLTWRICLALLCSVCSALLCSALREVSTHHHHATLHISSLKGLDSPLAPSLPPTHPSKVQARLQMPLESTRACTYACAHAHITQKASRISQFMLCVTRGVVHAYACGHANNRIHGCTAGWRECRERVFDLIRAELCLASRLIAASLVLSHHPPW